MKRQRFPQIVETWIQVLQKFVLFVLRDSDPLFRQIGERPIYEGGIVEVTQDSDIATSDFQSVVGHYTIEHEIVRNSDFQAFTKALLAGTLEMSRSQHQTFYSQLNAILDETGQTRDAGGRPFTWETFLEMWEMVDFVFDEQGNWIPQTLRCHPGMLPTIQRVAQEMDTDPEKKRQFDELFQRKREAFYAKEANRKLVD